MPTYFCPGSAKCILGANKLVSETRFPNGQINRPSGVILFKGHHAYSEAVTATLNGMGQVDGEEKLTEADVINFIEKSQPYKNGKIIKVKKDDVDAFHAQEAAVQRLARHDDEGIPEEVVRKVREGAAAPTETGVPG